MRKRILILGGARSGKSSFALREASSAEGRKAFIATAEALDDEMKIRIAKHRRERDSNWQTLEEPLEITSIIRKISGEYDLILIDCLTLWVSNIMMNDMPFYAYADELVRVIMDDTSPALLYLVSNEVGLGLVPETPLGRQYRDNLGYLNARIAAAATDVYFMAAGIPMKIKET